MPNVHDDELKSLLNDLAIDSSSPHDQERLIDLLLDDVEGVPKSLPLSNPAKAEADTDEDDLDVNISFTKDIDSTDLSADGIDGDDVDKELLQPDEAVETAEFPREAPIAPIKLKAKRGSLFAKLKGFFDPKIWPQDLHVGDPAFSLPKKIYIGYLTNIRKKDLIGYINEWVFDNNCNRSSCYYQTLAWNGGFVFEIQEGGSGHGVLQSVLRNLQAEDEITVPSIDRYIKVAKKFDGFSVYMLNEYEKHEESACIEFTDSLTPFYKRNHGLMLSGVISSTLSIGFLLTSWFMVNVVYNKDTVPVYGKTSHELPSQQINKISDIASREDAFLKSLTFAAGKWKINLETVQVEPQAEPEPDVAPAGESPSIEATGLPPLVSDAPQARVDVDLINLHQDLVRTMAEEAK